MHHHLEVSSLSLELDALKANGTGRGAPGQGFGLRAWLPVNGEST